MPLRIVDKCPTDPLASSCIRWTAPFCPSVAGEPTASQSVPTVASDDP